jgi:hypothetical protein
MSYDPHLGRKNAISSLQNRIAKFYQVNFINEAGFTLGFTNETGEISEKKEIGRTD